MNDNFMSIAIAVGLVGLLCAADLIRIIRQRIRWHKGKGPNDREIADALTCLSCYMKAMQREMKATKIKSITIDAEGDYDVATHPSYTINASQPAPVDLKPNHRVPRQ